MVAIVKVNTVPTVKKPVEGEHYHIVDGEPQAGDAVRITTSGGAVIFQSCYTPPSDPPAAPEFPTLSGSEFLSVISRALGFARCDQLMAKSQTVHAMILQARAIDRNSGDTPSAVQYLMTGDNALTETELLSIETEWKSGT